MKKKLSSALIITTIVLTTALSVMPTIQPNADDHNYEFGQETPTIQLNIDDDNGEFGLINPSTNRYA